MSIPEAHFKETRKLVSRIDRDRIAKWLLEQGYYAEQYVLPPPFRVENFLLQKKPFYTIKRKKEYKPTISELIKLSYPRSPLTEKTFGLIHPHLYHDIVWHLHDQWDFIKNHLFHEDIKIYSYSFPLPISKDKDVELGHLRVGRMIYEFIEMAENDLVAEAHEYTYLLKTDIKNCYPSIYTHSIAWALHGKKHVKYGSGRYDYTLLGNILDKLVQNCNDGCTNGIPIGPALSDLIAEIILAAVDKEVSKELCSIKFLGVRYKDDYRFLCKSKNDAEKIIKVLQSQLREFNLSLNESKSDVRDLPEGLYRTWVGQYQPLSLKDKDHVYFKKFESTLLAVLDLDKRFPDTGIIDKFLAELYNDNCDLKLILSPKEVLKAFSLLILLKKRRAKSFPQILAIVEDLIKNCEDDAVYLPKIIKAIETRVEEMFENMSDNLYDLVWLIYFTKANNGFTVKIPKTSKPPLLQSMTGNSQCYFNDDPSIVLFTPLKRSNLIRLAKYLSIFPKNC